MKLLIGFVLFGITQARIVEPICEDVIVHNIHHEKEVLLKDTDSPYQLVIDYDTHTLFFSYSNQHGTDMFSSAYLNLKTNEYGNIPGIYGGFASTVDEKKHVVYLGGGVGIYTFDFETKKATHIDGTSQSIWQMFFKNELYYSVYPDEHVYVFKDGKSERVPELANTRALLVALNKDLDYYFSNSSGLYKLSKSNGDTIYLGDYNVNAFTADNNGNLYFSTPEAIYFINEKDKVDHVVSIPNIYGVAIEADGNIIYATSDGIVRLKPTKVPCYVNEKISFNENSIL